MKWRSRSKKRQRREASSAPARAQKRSVLATRDASGRVKLVLFTEPNTRAQSYHLSAPMFEPAWQNALTESAANILVRVFEPDPTLSGAERVATDAMGALSGMSAGWLASGADGEVACKAGCAHCCHQPVSVSLAEGFAIYAHLRRTRSEAELSALTQRLTDRSNSVRGLTRAEQYSPQYPCPFLERGECSIYEVRPLVCRGMNSLDAEQCWQQMNDPSAKAAFFRKGGGRCYQEPIQGAHAMAAGLELGFADVFGLDMRAMALTDAMHLLLTDPSAGERWIRGEAIEVELSVPRD